MFIVFPLGLWRLRLMFRKGVGERHGTSMRLPRGMSPCESQLDVIASHVISSALSLGVSCFCQRLGFYLARVLGTIDIGKRLLPVKSGLARENLDYAYRSY